MTNSYEKISRNMIISIIFRRKNNIFSKNQMNITQNIKKTNSHEIMQKSYKTSTFF